MKTVLLGKTSPGFVYKIKETQTIPRVPGWAFGNDKRKPLNNNEKYEFYHIEDKYSRPEAGVDFCGPNQRKTKFSRAQRVFIVLRNQQFEKDLSTKQITPGPKYFPKMNPMKERKTEYTFGFRRSNKAFGNLGHFSSTKETVGPTTYSPNFHVSR